MNDIDWTPLEKYIFIFGKTLNHPAVASQIRSMRLVEDDYPSDDTRWFENLSMGLAFLFDGEQLDTVFLFSEGRDGFRQYGGNLVCDLTFSSSKEEVRKSLGPPNAFRDTETPEDGGFDKYVYPTHTAHFCYKKSLWQIELLTLGRLSPT